MSKTTLSDKKGLVFSNVSVYAKVVTRTEKRRVCWRRFELQTSHLFGSSVSDNVKGFFGMQRTLGSVRLQTVVVENTIGDIGVLLDFCDQNSLADGMDHPGWNEKYISFFDIDII